jgi:hypothetical protein
VNDWDRFMGEGRRLESESKHDAAESAYEKAWRAARTTGEENIAWGALRRVERITSEESGFYPGE